MGFSSIISLIMTVLGWFGFGSSKSDTQAAQASGEAQGKAEQQASDQSAILQDVQKANEARQEVKDAPASDLRSDDGFRTD